MLNRLAAIISLSLVLVMAGHAFAAAGLKIPGGGFDRPFVTGSLLRDQVVCCTGGEEFGEQMDVNANNPCGVDLPCFALPGVHAIASAHGSGFHVSDSRLQGRPISTPKEPPRPLS
jgi:hypothetical protein